MKQFLCGATKGQVNAYEKIVVEWRRIKPSEAESGGEEGYPPLKRKTQQELKPHFDGPNNKDEKWSSMKVINKYRQLNN